MQHYLKQFHDFSLKFVNFIPEEFSFYEKNLELVSYKKRDFILKAGETENYLYFILEGITKMFFTRNGKDICIEFGFPNTMHCSFISFETRKPSELSVKALSNVKMFRLHKSQVDEFHNLSKNSERFGRISVGVLLAGKMKREMMLLSHSAEEKYEYLLRKHPEVAKNIPVKDLASYLGIHPESLSRIRTKFKNNEIKN
jgi:CRP/FNR family transcriptional regulator, anaerobic regulatory protein